MYSEPCPFISNLIYMWVQILFTFFGHSTNHATYRYQFVQLACAAASFGDFATKYILVQVSTKTIHAASDLLLEKQYAISHVSAITAQ